MKKLTPIEVLQIFDAEAVMASGTGQSGAVTLQSRSKVEGFFSLELEITGDGTCKAEYQLANSAASNCRVPENAVAIATNLTKTSGPNSDGKVFLEGWSPGVAKFIKILITETGGANSVTINGWLAVQ